MGYVQGFAAPDPVGGGSWADKLGGFFSTVGEKASSFYDDNRDEIGGLVGDVLKKGISRAADAELEKRFGANVRDQYYQGEDGVTARAGVPTVTAPTVTVIGKTGIDRNMLYIGLAAVVLVLLLRR
jgi:hypothetical protein